MDEMKIVSKFTRGIISKDFVMHTEKMIERTFPSIGL